MANYGRSFHQEACAAVETPHRPRRRALAGILALLAALATLLLPAAPAWSMRASRSLICRWSLVICWSRLRTTDAASPGTLMRTEVTVPPYIAP